MPKIIALLLTLWMAPAVVAQDDPCGTVPDGVEVRFVFVVDCSGSMNSYVKGVSGPRRFEVVRRELNRQIDLLPEGEGVGLYMCAFNDKITTTLNYDSLNETQRQLAKTKLSGSAFESGGGTALRDAVISTLRDQQRWLQQDPTQRFVMVVILTDGEDRNSSASEADLISEFEKIQRFERQFSCAGHLTAAEVYLNGKANRALSNKRLATFVQGIDASKKAVQILPISVLVSSTEMTAHPVAGRSTLQLEVNSSCPKELVQLRCPYSIEVEGMSVGSGQLSLKNGRQEVNLEFPSTFQGFDKETSGVLRLDIASLRSGSGQPLTGPQEIPFTIAAAENIELDASRINIQPPSPVVGQQVVLSYRPAPDVPGVWSRSDGGPLQLSRNGWTATATFDTPGQNTLSLKGNPKAPRRSNTISVNVPVIDAKVKLAPFPSNLATGDSVTFSASVTPQAEVVRWRWDLNGMKQASRGSELKIDALDQSGDLRLEVSAFLKSDSGEELEISNSAVVEVSEAPSIQVDADQSVVAGKEMQVAITAVLAEQATLELRDIEKNKVVVSKPGLGLKPVFEQSSDGVKITQKIESIIVPFSPQDENYELVVTSEVDGRSLEARRDVKARPPVLTYKLVSPEVSGGVYELGQSKTFTLAVSGEAADLVDTVQFQSTGLSSERSPKIGVRSDGVATVTISGDAKDAAGVREGSSIKVTPKFFVGGQPIQPESQLSWDLRAQHKSIAYSILVPEDQVGAEILWGKSRAFSIQPMDDVAQVFWDIKMPDGLERSEQHQTLNWTFDKEGTYEISARVWRKSPGVDEVQCAPVVFEVTKEDISGNIYFPDGNFAKGDTHRFNAIVSLKGSYTKAWLEWKHPDENQPPVIKHFSVVQNKAEEQSPEYKGDRVMGIQVVLWATGPDGDVQVATASVDYGGPRVILWPGLITAGMLFLLFVLYRRLMGNHPQNWMLCCSVGEPGYSNVVKTAVRSKWSWFKQDIAQKRKEGVTFTLQECFARTPRMQERVGWWAQDPSLGRAAVKLTSRMVPDRTGHVAVEYSRPIPDELETSAHTANGKRYLKFGQESDWSGSSIESTQSLPGAEAELPDPLGDSIPLLIDDDATEDVDESTSWIYIWAEQKGRRGNPTLFNLFFFIALGSSVVIGLASWQYWFMSTNLGIL